MDLNLIMFTRRHLIAMSAAQACTPYLFVGSGQAQMPPTNFPKRTVRFIVPTAAGGPTDIVARMLAEKLSEMWRTTVVVENRTGAGTNIGNEYVARSDPDGYTILFATAALAINASLYHSLSYDPVTDFAPVSLVTQLPFFLFVPNSSPANSVAELVKLAKASPGSLTMASPGIGTAPHLAAALFMQTADIKMTHVPYRGAAPAFADVISGRVDGYFGSGALLTYANSGQVRVLATTGRKRDPAAPKIPTMQESGILGFEVMAWQALFAPAKTPPKIVRKLSADTNLVLANPSIIDGLSRSGYVAGGSSPEELERLLRSEITKWHATIESLGIKIN
jgi:tripartite-type tricarboxylate transporter receptor subunit TctC